MAFDDEYPIALTDTVAEAGRTIMMGYLAMILRNQAALADQSAPLDRVTVAFRRILHLLIYLNDYYEDRTIHPFVQILAPMIPILTDARQHRQLMKRLEEHQETIQPSMRDEFTGVIEKAQKKADKAQWELEHYVQSNAYVDFAPTFSSFLLQEASADRSVDVVRTPAEVRHLAPILLHQRLAAIRVYDDVPSAGSISELVALSQACVDFQDMIVFFRSVLNPSADAYLDSLQAVIDALHQLRWSSFVELTLSALSKLRKMQRHYLDQLIDEERTKAALALGKLPDLWAQLNAPSSYVLFHDALLALF